jgi:hypothetical protein
MRDLPRIAFLVVTDAIAVALLTVLLIGCVVAPAKPRDRMGDFVTNMASIANPDVAEAATIRRMDTARATHRAPRA